MLQIIVRGFNHLWQGFQWIIAHLTKIATAWESIYSINPRALERIRDTQNRGAQVRKAIDAAAFTLETESISLGPASADDQDLPSLVTQAKQAMEEVQEHSPNVDSLKHVK